MPERIPLPESLRGQSFRYAEARRRGVGEGRLRNSELAHPFHGVRAQPAGADLSPAEVVRKHCLDFLPLLRPGQYFSEITAAILWGVPLPPALVDVGSIHVTAAPPALAPRMRGVMGHRATGGTAVFRGGLLVSDPTTTWLTLAAVLSHEDLVAAGDYFVLDPAVIDPLDLRPFVSIDALVRAATDFSGRGARRARLAVRDIRQGAESRPETLLRLLLARAGLPAPQLNLNISDRTGRWIGRADLAWPDFRVIVEYDGDQHRTDSRQYEKDVRRIDRFIDNEFRVMRVRSRGLFQEALETVSRVASALRAGGWNPDRTYRPSYRS